MPAGLGEQDSRRSHLPLPMTKACISHVPLAVKSMQKRALDSKTSSSPRDPDAIWGRKKRPKTLKESKNEGVAKAFLFSSGLGVLSLARASRPNVLLACPLAMLFNSFVLCVLPSPTSPSGPTTFSAAIWSSLGSSHPPKRLSIAPPCPPRPNVIEFNALPLSNTTTDHVHRTTSTCHGQSPDYNALDNRYDTRCGACPSELAQSRVWHVSWPLPTSKPPTRARARVVGTRRGRGPST